MEIHLAMERDGYAIIPHVVDQETIRDFLNALLKISTSEAISQRAGSAFGIRNLLNVLPMARALANGAQLRSVVEPVLGSQARVVRGIFLDKNRVANWKVAWHQDLTIAVRQRMDVDGYGPWSLKAGITHVQPPVSVLEGMLALRLHLDDTDESNGALRVLPGSHKCGRLAAQDIQVWKVKCRAVTCSVATGGVMAMRPLLLHASSAASHPGHRRVLHLEYAASDLHGGLAWSDA